jgi:hypothetical protein
MIAPRRYQQQGFADGVPARSIAFEEEPPDRFGVWRSAGLARSLRRDPRAFESCQKQPRLGRFAGALAALDRDEPAAGNRAQCRWPQTR